MKSQKELFLEGLSSRNVNQASHWTNLRLLNSAVLESAILSNGVSS